MNDYLLPTADDFVETIAKSIAMERLQNEYIKICVAAGRLPAVGSAEAALDIALNTVWKSAADGDIQLKNQYLQDAKAAINAINLFLVTTGGQGG